MDLTKADPKGLVRESYRIDGITGGECRSIFLDWALSLPVGVDSAPALRFLITTYEPANPGHPMNVVLHDGLTAPDAPRRKGGRATRVGQD